MRVISQDGCWNIPYDKTSFKVNDNAIQADLPTGKMIVVARYESEERAKNAMMNLVSMAIEGEEVARFGE